MGFAVPCEIPGCELSQRNYCAYIKGHLPHCQAGKGYYSFDLSQQNQIVPLSVVNYRQNKNLHGAKKNIDC